MHEILRRTTRVVFVDALPRNALGKVLRYRVREGLIEPEG
jgi:acyl-coenzyme A synthetase/AMP-(fatty) acid ligase